MKLLLISVKSNSPAGGIATWTEHFLSHCQRNNIDCHLVNTEIIGKRTTTHKRNLWDEGARTCRIYRNLKKQLNSTRFDAVYLNTSCGTFGLFRDVFLARLITKKNVPLITHYHCEIPYWVKRKFSINALGKLAKMSQQNLVLCQRSLQFMQDRFAITPQKVPNFVDSSLLLEKAKNITGPVKQVIFVGNITEHKGAGEAYALARCFPQIRFLLVGNIGTQVASWDKPENVTLTGLLPQEQVICLLDESDVFLFPSHTEGCSMALMEAMARGLPAIATDTGANGEMLADNCGIIVNCHDVEAMAEALHKLDDPLLRCDMANNALRCIKDSYTEKNVDVLINCIQYQT